MGGKKKEGAKKKEEEEEEEVEVEGDEDEEEEEDDEEEEVKSSPEKKSTKRKAAETEDAPSSAKKGKGGKEGGGGGGDGEEDGGGGDAHSRVLSYFRRANRPYSAPVLFENLHHEIGKAALQRILDDLTAKSQSIGTHHTAHQHSRHTSFLLAHPAHLSSYRSSRGRCARADVPPLTSVPVRQAVEEGVR